MVSGGESLRFSPLLKVVDRSSILNFLISLFTTIFIYLYLVLYRVAVVVVEGWK